MIDDLRLTIDDLKNPRGQSSIVNRQSPIAIVLAALCLWMSPFAAPAIVPGAQAEDVLIKEALGAYQAGQLEVALGKLREAHSTAPENVYARLYLGLILYQKDPGGLEAQSLMESVVDRFPSNPDLLLRLMDSYLASKKAEKVPQLLERSAKARASDHRLALNVVYVLVRYEQLEPARRALDEFASLLQNPQPAQTGAGATTAQDPKLTREIGEVAFLRGLIAATSGRKDEAMQQFQAADRNDFPPRDAPQMKMLADALYRFEEYALAARAYEVYLGHFPQDNEARLQLAISYFSSTAFEKAQEQLKQVYDKSPGMPQVNYYMGRVFLETKNHEEARRSFEAELKVVPDSYQSMSELAYLDYMQGENEKCLQWLKKAGALSPEYPEMHFVYGLLYNRQGKYDLAIENLESVVRYNPKHITAQFQLSVAYRRIGNETKAQEHTDIYNKLLEEHRARTLGEDIRKR